MSKQHPITLSQALFTNKKSVQPIAVLGGLLDDVKARDSALKLTQNLFKFAAINTDDKQRIGDFDKAAGVIGMGRRLIRFIRWIPLTTSLTQNIFASDPLMIGIKSVHFIAGIVGAVCEDITTLDKLKVTRYDVSTFENMQKYATFTEASAGLIMCALEIKKAQADLRVQLKAANANPNADKAEIYKAFLSLHVQTMNAAKWFCEIVGQSFNLNLHSQQQVAIVANILSSSNALYCAGLRHLQAQQAKK